MTARLLLLFAAAAAGLSVICLEQSTVQPISLNWSSAGVARTVESELRVESQAADGMTLPEARVIRDVRRVNGRAPSDRDRTDRSGWAMSSPSHREGR